jgi:5-methylcytosine-specific restriction endonuclease McrA
MSVTYGTRQCAVCNASFAARSSTAKTCSSECARERKRAWTSEYQQRNREKIREKDQRWRQANPEKQLERSRRYEAAHREERNARFRDPVTKSAQWQAWYARNRERVITRATERARANPDARRLAQSKRRAATQGGTAYRLTPDDLRREVNRRGSECGYCQVRPGEHWDHRVPLVRGGSHGIGNMVLACAECNLQKHTKTVTEWRVWRVRIGLDDLPVL